MRRWRLFLCCIMLALPQASIADIEITDSHGKYRFAEPPKRVVVLNWALAEHMLEFGVTPVGMADTVGFQRHAMGKPSIPASVDNVGPRLSPDLNKIRQLNPDIILIGYSQRSLLRPLSNIATVIYFKNFGKRYNNAEKSIARFQELAKLFDKTEQADRLLASREQAFASLNAKLKAAFVDRNQPLVQLMVPSNGPNVLVFGENSMPFYAARRMGLQVLAAAESDQFGTVQINQSTARAQLTNNQSACRLLFTSYAESKLTPAELVQQDDHTCTKVLSYQNAFGGVMSLQYLSAAIVSALTD